MESADILQGIAEVAIGLAGFAGIAAGLGYRARGHGQNQIESDWWPLFYLP